MAEVKPFRGILYNSAKIEGDYSRISAPPYDIIPSAMRDELYERDEHNIIRLILGKSSSGDNEKENKYTRAAAFLDEWVRDGVLAKDETDAFYVYLQEYERNGGKCRRVGFIGLMKIEDPRGGKIFPHENTHAGPKRDRMDLIKEVKANLSPIFTVYSDKDKAVSAILEKAVSSAAPVIDIRVQEESNMLWRLDDEDSLKKISSLMEDRKIFIADGHHRYEVAREYRDIMRQQEGYNGNADHVMMYFADMESADNLTVLATHRVVKEMKAADNEIVGKLKKYFQFTECGNLEELMKLLKKKSGEGHVFGFFGGEKYLFMELKDTCDIEKMVNEEKSAEWKELDVSILHAVIFKDLLGVGNKEGNIAYVKEPEEAAVLVNKGEGKGAFFLNPTRVDQLKAVAERGDMMPQKSTYFYPKLLSGLVINKFE